MPKALEKVGENEKASFLAGRFVQGRHKGKFASIAQAVHDGDTISTSTALNFSVRFLGIDTPEISYHRPGEERPFVKPTDPKIVSALADPFGQDLAPIGGLSKALKAFLRAKASPQAGANHYDFAKQAHNQLEALISADATELGAAVADGLPFFLAFAYEALDGYGRFLCYVHPDQPTTPKHLRKRSYNERMLQTGLSAPYFIFPNVDPFRSQGSPLTAAMKAISPQNILATADSLTRARNEAKAARSAQLGVHQPGPGLIFDAFELRLICDRRLPSRWIIDLSTDDRVLHHPQTYPAIPLAEDRLWVPAEFVALFESAGWRRGPSPSDLES